MNTVELFGIPVWSAGFDEVIALIHDCVARGSQNEMFFFNAHSANLARGDGEYRRILKSAAYVFPDGLGVRVAAALAGRPLRPDLNPTDLYPRLCAALEGTGISIYLLGGEPGIAQRAATRAQSIHPGLTISGSHHGYLSTAEETAVVAAIREAKTDILFVGMGAPKQEKWIRRNFVATGAKVALGVGALFDYHAGKVKRAPVWMRTMGLEWLGRLIPGRGEPRRLWRRYLLGNVRFLWMAVGNALLERRRSENRGMSEK